MPSTRKLTSDDLPWLAELFDEYRQFYGQPSNPAAARAFISERLTRRDSHLIGVFVDDQAVGFAQLYPSFSSVSMTRKLILNDMYVAAAHRRAGAARALLAAVDGLARELDATALVLATQNDNSGARRLYSEAGWREETDFVYYNRRVPNGA